MPRAPPGRGAFFAHFDALSSLCTHIRTTLDNEDDVLAAAKEMASRQRLSAGQLISRLLREAMSGSLRAGQGDGGEGRAVAGFLPFASQGVLIANAQIDALRDAEGV